MDLLRATPPLALLRFGVAAVWLYEGLWSKLLGGVGHQVSVVAAHPLLGQGRAALVLKAIGVVEIALGVWVLSGIAPGWCVLVQTVLLVFMNANGLLFARHVIPDPGGMVVKNFAFLLLAWVVSGQAGRALP
jgi:hypothetical protein